MRVALKHILKSIVIAVLLLQAGCGALQLWWYAPDNEREDWSEWKQCFGKPLSKVGITHSVFLLRGRTVQAATITTPRTEWIDSRDL